MIIAIITFLILFILYQNSPDVTKLKHRSPQPLIHLFDNKNHLFKTFGDYQSNYITYGYFPKHLVDAVISIEDKRFFSHYGIDFLSLPRAIIKNLIAGRYAQGASSISQQLAKMLFLTPEKTLSRKVKEMLLAIKIEKNFSKHQILEMYLNKAYFGSGNNGIISAAKDYFDKEVSEISLNEAALLAGLLKAPSKYSPKINTKLSQKRTAIVLEQMLKNKYITEEELVIAQYQDNAWNKNFTNTDNYKYFTDWVRSDIDEYSAIFPFNLKIKTTLDGRINKIADQVISQFYQKTPTLKNTQISFIAMQLDGAILSMIGGANYKKSQFNSAVYGKRQSGSAFKLFVYLEALKQGYTNSDKVVDRPINIDGWEPKNYNNKYHGEMTIREAFVRSINSVAASLAKEIGIKNIVNLAHNMGIKAQIPNLPSISLGTSELSLLELTTAYAVVANGGYKVKPYNIVAIKDDYDNNLFLQKNEATPEQILDSDVISDMSNLLHGVVVWGTGKAANVPELYIRGKTGTSQNYRDAWFIGFTEDLVIGIWIGSDNKNKDTKKISGGSYPAQIFQEIITRIYFSD